MHTRLRPSFVPLALALVVAGLLLPTTSDGKVTCSGRGIPDAPAGLPGLPREAEVDRLYQLTVDLPDAHAVNPEPVLMAVRCASLADGATTGRPGGSDSALFRGAASGRGGSEFDVRFRQPGHWRVASMDVSGRFLDHGLYTVRPASIAPATADGSTQVPLWLGVGGVVALAGLTASLLWRRTSLSSRKTKGSGTIARRAGS
jgi:hypothetical protein